MKLIDSFGRRIEYLRVSVTDRCNYSCFYCMPTRRGSRCGRGESLHYEELTRLIRLFSELGVHKVRLTGGEPLVRRGTVEFAATLGELPGITDLSVSTNGHLLERFAIPLRKAGVTRVNVSLDSLEPDNFKRITRGGDVRKVLAGIDAALQAGMDPVKLNMVVLKGINDHEIEPMLDFATDRNVHLRFIETMPIGAAGMVAMAYYYPARDILDRVRAKFGADLIPVTAKPGAGPARCHRIGRRSTTIGVISPISRHFCAGCNRVRLTAKGDVVLCLGQQHTVGLGQGLRAGWSDEQLKEEIMAAIARKPAQHRFLDDVEGASSLPMNAIGG